MAAAATALLNYTSCAAAAAAGSQSRSSKPAATRSAAGSLKERDPTLRKVFSLLIEHLENPELWLPCHIQRRSDSAAYRRPAAWPGKICLNYQFWLSWFLQQGWPLKFIMSLYVRKELYSVQWLQNAQSGQCLQNAQSLSDVTDSETPHSCRCRLKFRWTTKTCIHLLQLESLSRSHVKGRSSCCNCSSCYSAWRQGWLFFHSLSCMENLVFTWNPFKAGLLGLFGDTRCI